MSIPVACGVCSKRFRVDRKLAGKRVECPNCHVVLTIPPIDSADSTGTPAAHVESDKDLETTTPAAANSTYGTVTEPELPLLCPSCARPLDSKTVLCVDCGYDTRVGKQLVTETDGAGSSGEDDSGEKRPESVSAVASAIWHFLHRCMFSTIGKILGVYALIILLAFSPLLCIAFAGVILWVIAMALNEPELMHLLWFTLIIGPLLYITFPLGLGLFCIYTFRLLAAILDYWRESS